LFSFVSTQGDGRPKFRQRRVVAVTASYCYAKITPAALHCDDPAAATSKLWDRTRIRLHRHRSRHGGLSVPFIRVPDGIGFEQELPVD
jgi:hypothetical protein